MQSLSAMLAILIAIGLEPASAQEYEVIELGTTGISNVAWSLNQYGDVCGWSQWQEPVFRQEGYVYSQGEVTYVGFAPGRSSSELWAVNNLGHAVGTSGLEVLGEDPRAFVWLGHVVDLGTLGGSRSSGYGINDLGQAVGSSTLPGDTSSRAFIWENGQMSTLPTLGGEHATAFWINNAGQIVGAAADDPLSSVEYAAIWEDGQIHQLPPLNGEIHEAHYIPDNGDIAGLVRLPESEGRPRAAIWRNGELAIQLGTLADGTPFDPIALSVARGINADGVIVGMSTADDGLVRPFIYRDGEMTQLDDLMPPPWVAGEVGPGAINDAGQIAVWGKITGVPGSSALLLNPLLLFADGFESGDTLAWSNTVPSAGLGCPTAPSGSKIALSASALRGWCGPCRTWMPVAWNSAAASTPVGSPTSGEDARGPR